MEKYKNLTIAAPGSNEQEPRQRSDSTHGDTVHISKSEYENLLRASAELDDLKSLLLERGRSSGNNGLIDATPKPKPTAWADDPSSSDLSIEIPSPRRQRVSLSSSANDGDESSEGAEIEKPAQRHDRKEPGITASYQNFENAENRAREPCTVALKFPRKVTHADITAAVRGGALMGVNLLEHREVAHITFVEPASAKAFVEHTRANPFFVAGQPAIVKWSQSQWYPGPYISHRMKTNQASRNIVIYAVRKNITEATIRGDMCHIHKMAIIYVKFSGGNAYISTNSVNNALFARTCMLSRTLYKGLQIGFYPDDCDAPFAPVGSHGLQKSEAAPKEKGPVYNPYDVLSLHDMSNEDEEVDGDGEEGQEQGHNNGVALPVW